MRLHPDHPPLTTSQILHERGVCVTSLAYPPLLEGKSLLAPLPLPLPGTAEAFKRFGAVPTSARAATP